MAHGCIIKALQAGREFKTYKWSVRKRDGVWCVYPGEQCCPAATFWDFPRAIERAHELALRRERNK